MATLDRAPLRETRPARECGQSTTPLEGDQAIEQPYVLGSMKALRAACYNPAPE